MITLHSPHLTTSEKQQFGGEFSFLGKWTRKGIGSPRIAYEKGISEIDDWRKDTTSEAIFVSFELLKNGLIFRFNQNSRLKTMGVKISEIKKIKLTGHRIKVRYIKFDKPQTRVVLRGELEIEEEGTISKFSVLVKDFEALLEFFKKRDLIGKFEYKIIEKDLEEDNISPNLEGILRIVFEVIQ